MERKRKNVLYWTFCVPLLIIFNIGLYQVRQYFPIDYTDKSTSNGFLIFMYLMMYFILCLLSGVASGVISWKIIDGIERREVNKKINR